MTSPIDFYFDFSSPYGYLAAQRIDALAAKHGRRIVWRPILLGVAFKTTGMQPLPNIPLKGEYSKRDFARSARFHGIAFKLPANFPVGAVAATRAYYWLAGRDEAKAVELARAIYKAYFVDDLDISAADSVVRIGASIGLDADALRAGMNDAATKDRTKNEVDAAIAKGVFGSPYIVVDGEPFWGMDRFDQLERWLAQGPF
jgi:2-hydroxychromene-2-carboxylate isomerase